MNKDIIDALSILGLSESEHDAFMIVYHFKSGITARFVADELDVPRSTAYSILNSLTAKTIVKKQIKHGVSIFLTNDQIICDYIDFKYATMKKALETLQKISK